MQQTQVVTRQAQLILQIQVADKVGLVKKVLLNKDISDEVKAKAVNRLTKNKISQATKNSYISTKNSKNN